MSYKIIILIGAIAFLSSVSVYFALPKSHLIDQDLMVGVGDKIASTTISADGIGNVFVDDGRETNVANQATGKVIINLEKNEYKVGEKVGATIINGMDKSVWYWDNRARVVPLVGIQIYENGSWVEFERKSACACKANCGTAAAGWMELPGVSVFSDFWETKDDCLGKTAPGKYRFWFSYSMNSTGQENPVNFPKVYSDEFAIVATDDNEISCGDGSCEIGETADNCAKDCAMPTDCIDAATQNKINDSDWREYKSDEIGVSFSYPTGCVFGGDYGDWGRKAWFNCEQFGISIAAKNHKPYGVFLDFNNKSVDVNWSAQEFAINMEMKKRAYGQNEILFVKKLIPKSLLVAEYAAIEGLSSLDLFVISPLNANYPNLVIRIKYPFERDSAIKEYLELARAKKLDYFVPIDVYKKIAQKIEAGSYSKELECRIETVRKIADSAVVSSEGKISEFVPYEWQGITFKYPESWQVEEIRYRTPAQAAQGLPEEVIGLKIFKDEESKADFIAIGGRQVSCDPPGSHALCAYIQELANYIYTDSKVPGVLNLFDKIRNSITFCGNGKCETGETATNCTQDCK
jgi:hypothetical protein